MGETPSLPPQVLQDVWQHVNCHQWKLVASHHSQPLCVVRLNTTLWRQGIIATSVVTIDKQTYSQTTTPFLTLTATVFHFSVAIITYFISLGDYNYG